MIFNPLFIDSDTKQINQIGLKKTANSYLFRDIIKVAQNSNLKRSFNSSNILSNILNDIRGIVKSSMRGNSQIEEQLDSLLFELNSSKDFSNNILNALANNIKSSTIALGSKEEICEILSGTFKNLEKDFNLYINSNDEYGKEDIIEYINQKLIDGKAISIQLQQVDSKDTLLLKIDKIDDTSTDQQLGSNTTNYSVTLEMPQTAYAGANAGNLLKQSNNSESTPGVRANSDETIKNTGLNSQDVSSKVATNSVAEVTAGELKIGNDENIENSTASPLLKNKKDSTSGSKAYGNIHGNQQDNKPKIYSFSDYGKTYASNAANNLDVQLNSRQDLPTNHLKSNANENIVVQLSPKTSGTGSGVNNSLLENFVNEMQKLSETELDSLNTLHGKIGNSETSKSELGLLGDPKKQNIAGINDKNNITSSEINIIDIDTKLDRLGIFNIRHSNAATEKNTSYNANTETNIAGAKQSEINQLEKLGLKTISVISAKNNVEAKDGKTTITGSEHDLDDARINFNNDSKINHSVSLNIKKGDFSKTSSHSSQTIFNNTETRDEISKEDWVTNKTVNEPLPDQHVENKNVKINNADKSTNIHSKENVAATTMSNSKGMNERNNPLFNVDSNNNMNGENRIHESEITSHKVDHAKAQDEISDQQGKENKHSGNDKNQNTESSDQSIKESMPTEKQNTQNKFENYTHLFNSDKKTTSDQFQNLHTETVKIRSHERLQPELNAKLLDEITDMAISEKKDKAVINLEPETLGKIKIALEIIDNKINARFEVENHAVKEMLQHQTDILKENLGSNGLMLNSINISLNNSEQKNGKANKSKRKESHVENVGEKVKTDKGNNLKNLGYNTYEFIA